MATKRLLAPGTRAFALVEVMVVLILMVLVGGYFANQYLGSHSAVTGKKQRTPMVAAQDVVCQSNLSSIRQSMAANRAGSPDAKNPGSLMEMKEIPAEMRKCPVGGESYIYDPQTGTVSCPHPGHERY